MPDQPERTAPPAFSLPEPARPGGHPPRPGGAWLRRIGGWIAGAAVAFYFLIVLTILALRYAVLPNLDQFRPRVEAIATRALAARVTLGGLKGSWQGLSPGVELTDLRIDDAAGQPALRVPHVLLALSWRSLTRLQPVFTALQAEQPEIVVTRAADGRLNVGGVALGARKGKPFAFNNWLLSQRALVVRNATLHWRDAMHAQPEWTASGISVAVFNSGRLHRLAVRARDTGGLSTGPLDLRARFTHALLTTPGNPSNWQGEFYLDMRELNLPMLARWAALPVEVHAGRLDARAWTGFARGRLTSGDGRLRAATLDVRAGPARAPLDLPALSVDYSAAHRGDTFSARFSDLSFDLRENRPLDGGAALIRHFQASRFDGRFRPASARAGEALGVTGDLLDFELLARLSRSLPLPPNAAALIDRFDPHGLLRDYTFAWERAVPARAGVAGKPAQARLLSYRVAGDMENVGIAAQAPPPGLTPAGHPHLGLPGFTGVSGHIDADERTGRLSLAARDAAVTVRGLLDLPTIRFDTLAGDAHWRVEPVAGPGAGRPAFDVQVVSLMFANPDAAGRVDAHYANPGSGRGSLDLTAHFDRAAVPKVPRYLPTSIGPRLRQYLGHALQAGNSAGGTIEVSGMLDDFPFRRPGDTGVFHIVAPFEGGRVDFSPYPARAADGQTAWPAFDGLSGKFELNRDRIAFDVERGHYGAVVLSQVAGRIDALADRTMPLVITGNADGPLRGMLDYLAHSPLAAKTGGAIGRLDAAGPAALRLRVQVPRTEHPHPAVAGTLNLPGNRLAYAALPPLTEVAGRIDFTEKSGTSRGVTGRFLGGEFRATGDVAAGGAYQFKLNGRIAADQTGLVTGSSPLARAIVERLSGSAPYEASIKGTKHAIPEIVANSDLTGLGIDLPDPVKKAPGAPWPMHLTIKPPPGGDNGMTDARVRFGPLDAHYQWLGGIHPTAVRGALGVNHALAMPARGVTAAIDLKRVDADLWRSLAQQLEGARGGGGGSGHDSMAQALAPDHLSAKIGALTLFNRRWDDVDLGANANNGGWTADLASKQVSGKLDWRAPGSPGAVNGALRARMSRVSIPAAMPDRAAMVPVLPKSVLTLPALDIAVDDLMLRGQDLGKGELVARNRTVGGQPVWQLDRLALRSTVANLDASGSWGGGPAAPAGTVDSRRTGLEFTLAMQDAGALLDRLGMPRTIQGGNGEFNGRIGWVGSPHRIDEATLHGNLTLDLANGQILRVDPGIAKLLGVLSLQSLTRFLVLDFKSVTDKGLPFTRLGGTGAIDHGIATTHDFAIDSPIAKIDMQGSADIPREQQNLKVSVAPKINATTAALAAAVVNPLLGLGTYVAQLVLSESISHSFALHYAVSGSWSHPHVERTGGVRGNMGKSAVLSTDGAPQPAGAP